MKLSQKQPATNADALITIEGVAGYWETFSGLEETISRAQFSDGQSNRKRFTTSGSSELAECTISRSFDPEDSDDIAAYDWAQARKCGDVFQVQVRFVKRCGDVEFRGERALYLYNCRITKISFMSGFDTGAGDDTAKLELSFTLDDYSWS